MYNIYNVTLYIIKYTISIKVFAGKETIFDIFIKVVMGITEP